jgi:glyoxylase-like metal-dependent hydrolase (beta-lactamase superfamily II)
MMGMKIQGVADLLEKTQIPIHINKHETKWVARTTGLNETDLVQHEGGDKVSVGDVSITFVHTPGHTPGSQCFLVEQRLVAGDTLFLDGCGRTDLPGGNPGDLYTSLQTLASLPAATIVCPGHQYSALPSANLGDVVSTNHVFKPSSQQQWLEWFGH